jgi:hypothetical protein
MLAPEISYAQSGAVSTQICERGLNDSTVERQNQLQIIAPQSIMALNNGFKANLLGLSVWLYLDDDSEIQMLVIQACINNIIGFMGYRKYTDAVLFMILTRSFQTKRGHKNLP